MNNLGKNQINDINDINLQYSKLRLVPGMRLYVHNHDDYVKNLIISVKNGWTNDISCEKINIDYLPLIYVNLLLKYNFKYDNNEIDIIALKNIIKDYNNKLYIRSSK